jgi:5-hydroxyisourate hydrolase/2-oxo-4-hydroxy-4-carboxy-5-ureidoimidazoline decarboxylase
MDLRQFNQQEKAVASDSLFSCCGAEKWVSLLLQHFPFASEKDLIERSTSIWYEQCGEDDWMEAFSHHPKIGDLKSLEEKFASSKHLTSTEQAGVADASHEVLVELAEANKSYHEKFGFIFIVCATGKSASEMLRLLTDRIQNTNHEELQVAMNEQHKITIIRLKKILNEADWSWMRNSQLTTHVLDTSLGKPGADISIKLQKHNRSWQTIAQGVTNADGRISDLLPPEKMLDAGNYKMVFETKKYFEDQNLKSFYPSIEVQFTIAGDQHYHVPLLVNPFGYSTYRGS